MKSDLPKRFREGDELTASLINDILGEIWRWRNMEGMPPIHVSEADSSFGPPVISFSSDAIEGQLYPGTTGAGYATGTPWSPATPNATSTGTSEVVIYTLETHSGWTSGNTITITSGSTTTMAYNIYSSTIAATKTAWYWKSPSTGNYYIVTADCP